MKLRLVFWTQNLAGALMSKTAKTVKIDGWPIVLQIGELAQRTPGLVVKSQKLIEKESNSAHVERIKTFCQATSYLSDSKLS